MEWHMFTYTKSTTSNQDSFTAWLERLLNGVHAEQFVIIDKGIIAAYFASNYRDEFDANGNPI